MSKKARDWIGEKFGMLTIIDHHGRQKHEYPSPRKIKGKLVTHIWFYDMYTCRCDCGVEKLVRLSHMKSGNTVSCGCYKKKGMRRKSGDIIGKTFGRLTVKKKTNIQNPYGEYYYECECSCGKKKLGLSYPLRKGKLQSCGCLPRGRKPEYDFEKWKIKTGLI